MSSVVRITHDGPESCRHSSVVEYHLGKMRGREFKSLCLLQIFKNVLRKSEFDSPTRLQIPQVKFEHEYRSMSYFMPAPKLNLETAQELLDFLQSGEYPDGFTSLDKYKIRSTYIIEAIKDVMKRENRNMAYNREVTALVRERLGLETLPKEISADEESMLATLVYNAQKYRRSEEYVDEGYEPFTKDLMEKAFALGKKIDVRSESFITIIVNGVKQAEKKSLLTVRMIEGQLYSFRPRKRNQCVVPDGRPARLA